MSLLLLYSWRSGADAQPAHRGSQELKEVRRQVSRGSRSSKQDVAAAAVHAGGVAQRLSLHNNVFQGIKIDVSRS